MLFETLGKLKQRTIMTSIIVLAIGIILLICPEVYIDSLITLAGYVLIIAAIVLVLDFITGKRSLSDYIMLGIALIIAILGLVVLVSHENILPVLSWLFGLVLILLGIEGVHYTLAYARRAGRAGWWILIILSVIMIAAGFVIVINPWWHTADDFLDIIAFALIYSAAVGIVRVIWSWPVRSE